MINNYDVAVIGGGLAGLSSAIQLGRAGLKVVLFEKKKYPFHKVCGEYISNETRPFLQSLGVDFNLLQPAEMDLLRLSDTKGRSRYMKLDLGGFGISRFVLDNHMCRIALKNNVQVFDNTTIKDLKFNGLSFSLTTNDKQIVEAGFVIGSHGKRSVLDRQMQRSFMQYRSSYMAVKYHIKTNYPTNEIGLDNFEGGYCGISKIEEDKYCLCYLTRREHLRKYGFISALEENLLFRNPVLRDIFSNSAFLFQKPEVINEISFQPKKLVDNHVFMAGDAAGMISPLCGNGMAMALHSSKILSELLIASPLASKGRISFLQREELEKKYTREWHRRFSLRLKTGRMVQRVFGHSFITDPALLVLNNAGPLKRWLIRNSHGEVF